MTVPDRGRSHHEARLRTVRKKLVQIAALEEKLTANPALEITIEQRAKLSRKVDLEAELGSLLMPTGASCGFNNAAGSPPRKHKVDMGAAVSAKCSHCELLVQPFTALWASWYCSRCGRDELTLRSPAYGCAQQDVCVKLEDWAICEVCAVDEASLNLGKNWKATQCDKGSDCDSACSTKVEDAAHTDDTVRIKAEGTGKKVGTQELEFLEAVQPYSPATQASDRLRGLIKAASKLSWEAFGSDVLEDVSRKSKWKLTILARRSSSCPRSGLLGFVVYKVRPDAQAVSVANVAVVPEERGSGHGQRIMSWCSALAKRQADINSVILWSLPAAVQFYRKIGFKAINVKHSYNDEYTQGQAYMEMTLKRGRGARILNARRR